MTLLEMPGEFADGSEPAGGIRLGQWRLARVELVNWGTFHGLHSIDIARAGHLFTGASGSGKSSLLDAIATVLTPDRWLRFNAAAQEASARGDDRSLVSYVRGAWSKEADEHLDRAVSTYLRAGATWSGILLRYENGRVAPVTVARLFHLRGSSVDKADLKDACFVDRSDVGLADFREHVASGIEARRIKGAWPEATVTTNGSHATFYSKLRRLLGINSQNALHLLHKTQSAKNLGSLDQLFRTFMLDEPRTFDRAKNAVEQFGELSKAHRHVVELRRQADDLRTLDMSIADYEQAAAVAAEAQRLGDLIEPFQNALSLQIATDERGLRVADHARASDAATRAEAARAEAAETHALTERRTLQEGGADAQQLRERVTDAEAQATETARRWARLGERLRSIDVLDAPTTAAEFSELQHTARRELAAAAPAAAHDHGDNRAYFAAKDELDGIDRELAELRTRKSNLPPALLLARRHLADELGVGESALPFAGELIEVLPEFAEWSGAIERVLYPIASALLVRDEHLPEVRRRVEGRNLGARLVFEAVPAIAEPPRAARSTRSLLHRIRMSDGPFHDWLSARVAAEFDYACVDHPDDLDGVERGVTIGGQVKKNARRYEKNDRHAVDDRRQWILGFDNEAKVELLLERRRGAVKARDVADARLKESQAQRDALTRRRTVFEELLTVSWEEVDRTAADDAVRARQRQLTAATTENVQLQDALREEESARAALTTAEATSREAALAQDVAVRDLREVESAIAEFTALLERPDAEQVTEADSLALDTRYRAVQRKIDRRVVDAVGRKVSEALHREENVARSRLTAAEAAFAAGAAAFAARWPAASADLSPNIADRTGYRALLAGIEERGLPEHEGNFLKLLREKSRDLIGHLLSDIRDAPRQVEERIDPVNASLGRSRFDVERYLFIQVKTRRSPEVGAFMDDLRTVVDGAWADEDLASAERRFAVLDGVMQRLASSENADVAWRRRCLDTREHVVFMAHERDLAGRTVNVHDSSAGLSGGQRQKLVIFCLAAALRYQLAADEDDVPRYGTIILDEAFDKADSRYTRMAMDVFVEFGFHMILATPEKLLQTIEPYVGAVTVITNATRKESRVASVAFERAQG